MTEDARGEAERIVDALHDIWQRQPSEPAVTEQQVVAALAAAMRNHGAHAHHGLCDSIATEGKMACDCGTAELRDALSALRARAGEET